MDKTEYELSIDQRKLMWAAIGLLAVLWVILGIGLLGLRARVHELAMVGGPGYVASYGNAIGATVDNRPSDPYSPYPVQDEAGGPANDGMVPPMEPIPDGENPDITAPPPAP